MLPKDIVVFLEETEGCESRLAFAATLAKAWQAHLISTFVADQLDVGIHAGFAVGGGLAAMLEHRRAAADAAAAHWRGVFDGLVARRSFTAEWRVAEDALGETLMLHARHASLSVVGPPAVRARAVTSLSLSERVILASGRPTLLLPVDWPPERSGRRLVVGWNASREATRAIADAMPFLRTADAIDLVVVDAKASGRHGADPGVDMARHLARQGVRVTLEQRQGSDAGTVLLEHCDSVDADLLVMGARSRSPASQFLFGGATRTVLAEATVPLLLSR